MIDTLTSTFVTLVNLPGTVLRGVADVLAGLPVAVQVVVLLTMVIALVGLARGPVAEYASRRSVDRAEAKASKRSFREAQKYS